jgi:hypothetical protein
MFGRGKKKVASTPAEKPAKKSRTTRGSSKSGPGGTSQATQPPPPQPPVQIDPRFVSESAAKRYEQISRFKFVQEKGFSVDLLRAVPEIKRELRRRKWVTFNEILLKVEKKPGNESWAKEFFANASEHKNAEGERSYTTLVRGVEIDFSPMALNRFLGTKEYNTPCPLYLEREKLDEQLEPARRVVRDAVSLPGTPWLKVGNSQKPTKI